MRNLTRLGSYISNRIGRAIADYNLIEDKDRILVAVSGGKDSLTMLRLLNERRRWAPIEYELVAMHIESDYRCQGCVHTDVLEKIFLQMNIEYHFKDIKILDADPSCQNDTGRVSSPRKHGGLNPSCHNACRISSSRMRGGLNRKVSCFWCSWNRRKALFESAEELHCSKIAFGHHKDDIIETLLLNMFYHGETSAMNPSQELFGGAVTIIRPLCYVEEDKIRAFALESKFPHHLCACPNSVTSKRRMMKDLIKTVEKDCRYVKTNLLKSIARVNRDYTRMVEEVK